MPYETITDGEIDPGSPGSTALFTKLRDNPIEIAQRGTGAPAVLGASIDFIEKQTFSATATADFTGFVNADYDQYLFVLTNVKPATDNADLEALFSTNGGSSYDTGYDGTHLEQDTSFGSARTVESGSGAILILDGMGTASGEDGVSGEFKIMGAANATRTAFLSEAIGQDTLGNPKSRWSRGYRTSAVDTDAIRFRYSSGNFESGSITMYGIRNA